MGQAKKRGTFEQRQAAAVERNRIKAEEEARKRADEAKRKAEARSSISPAALAVMVALGSFG